MTQDGARRENGFHDRVYAEYVRLANAFFAIFYLIIVGFPCAILYLQGYTRWMWLYLALALVLLAVHGRIAIRVLRSLDDTLEPGREGKR